MDLKFIGYFGFRNYIGYLFVDINWICECKEDFLGEKIIWEDNRV